MIIALRLLAVCFFFLSLLGFFRHLVAADRFIKRQPIALQSLIQLSDIFGNILKLWILVDAIGGTLTQVIDKKRFSVRGHIDRSRFDFIVCQWMLQGRFPKLIVVSERGKPNVRNDAAELGRSSCYAIEL